MTKKYSYKIFPTTFKARLLLAAAFVAGLGIVGGYIAFALTTSSFSYGIECSGSDVYSCLDAQDELSAESSSSCSGYERRVCLVPLGEISPAVVRGIVEYYEQEYDLPVTVLSPRPLSSYLIYAPRDQVDARALIGYMRAQFPDAAWDPNVVLVGLTPVDMYMSTSHYRYVFGLPDSYTRGAVVSTSHMHPFGIFAGDDDDVTMERARKLFTKYVGLLYYGISPSDDPTSVMYNNILGPSDLDRMHEPYPFPPE